MKEPEKRLFLSLQVPDLKAFPIWESIIDHEADVSVFPVKDFPVSSLLGRVVGTQVTLGNGNQAWAIIMNLDTTDARKNRHLVQLEIERDGKWFFLDRYWDVEYPRSGPDALAQFLGMAVDEVFPITYDVRQFVEGNPPALVGTITREPEERLSRDQIIRMAVP
jgi:hypothetical protein